MYVYQRVHPIVSSTFPPQVLSPKLAPVLVKPAAWATMHRRRCIVTLCEGTMHFVLVTSIMVRPCYLLSYVAHTHIYIYIEIRHKCKYEYYNYVFIEMLNLDMYIYIYIIYIYIYIKTTKLISLAMSQCNSTTPCVPSVGHPDFGSWLHWLYERAGECHCQNH